MAEPDDSDMPPWEAEAPERDEATDDMFGGPPSAAPAPQPAATAAYTVIARKYRPRRFEDLIGQEAMVRTLTNAFSSGRIAQAFMLTGVRGVGKTTTARLIARALNYQTDTIDAPTIALTDDGRHDKAIMEGRHIDVHELDAASHTGVDNMRDILDSVRYGPVEARYKVYIIDEVHMLSKGAFNALLKTLEEPPPHAKFIFATTEIRKVPVTILSRCQRFDLRRVEPDVIAGNLRSIAANEGARLDDEAVMMIARAAEGSVRDAQSLLDQAIVQAEDGAMVTAAIVRDMLGLADRAITISLFEQVMKGEIGEALETAKTLYGYGADPAQIALDLLDHAHAAAIAKTLGPDVLAMPKDQAARLTAVGVAVSAGSLSRVWQMLLKAHDEVRQAPDPLAALEMALIRLAYAADLPGPEEALKALQSGEGVGPGGGSGAPQGGSGGGGGGSAARMAAPRPSIQIQTAEPQSFEDVLRLIETNRDISLLLDVKKYVRPISFRPGAITFEPAPGAPSNLAGRLVSRLKDWTSQPWLVVAEGGGGAESAYEREMRERREVRVQVEADPFVREVMDAFPGAEIVEIRALSAPVAEPVAEEGADSE